MREQFSQMKARWENEKAAIGKVQELRRQLEQLGADIDRAEQEYDLNKAAELKCGRLPGLQKELEAEEKKAEEHKKNPQDSLLRDKVTDEEIARIVERWTGIPVARLMEGEREKVLHLPELLHQRVIGQNEAVERGERSHSPLPCGDSGSQPAAGLLPVSGSHRRGENGAGQGAGPMLVR